MSLGGGFEEGDESFFSRASSIRKRPTSASNPAILASSGAAAASIGSRTSSSVNVRVILPGYALMECQPLRQMLRHIENDCFNTLSTHSGLDHCYKATVAASASCVG